MATTTDAEHRSDRVWRTSGRTTIRLEVSGDGQWRATQVGLDVTGHGETAALAAAAFCREVARRTD